MAQTTNGAYFASPLAARFFGHALPWLPSLALALSLLAQAEPCHAEWSKDIECPAGTIYRDLRPYAGREEFCERLLPGSLRVKDGPYLSWFSEGHPGRQGNYNNGRQVGRWLECDRFDRCKHTTYERIFPSEKERPDFRPEIPLSYQDGKYTFDFGSCRSTWLIKTGDEDLNLNIGGSGNRCVVSYIPQRVMDHGGEGTYNCSIPFAVGKRKLDSLDLMSELPRLGLPQFCRVSHEEELMLVDTTFMDVATTGDVQCATLARDDAGHEVLTFTLKRYVSELATELAVKKGPLIARLCGSGDRKTTIMPGAGGRTRFVVALDDDAMQAKKEKRCIGRAVVLKSSCP